MEYKSVSPLIVSEVYRDSKDELWLSTHSLAKNAFKRGELSKRLEDSLTRSLLGHLKKASDQLESAEKARDYRVKVSNGLLWVDIETSHLEVAIDSNWDQGFELSGIRGLAIRMKSQDPLGSKWLHWEQHPKTGWIEIIDPAHAAKTFGDFNEFIYLTRSAISSTSTHLQSQNKTQNLEEALK